MKKTGPSEDQKHVYWDNSGQNLFNKIEKSIKTGHDKKSLISTSECSLTATV